MSATHAAATLRIGITPLCDSAPIVVAAERGFFAEEGLRVELSREPSWANIRDKLFAGALDAAHMLAPMPLAATLGVGPLQQPMGTAFSLGLGGNAVTLSRALWRRMQALDPEAMAVPATRGRALARALAERRAAGAPALRLATVFPVSMHGYELRFWLAASGLVPDRDVLLRVVPPPRMVAELEAGSIDGFCVGEPWSSVAVLRGSGVIALTAHDLWNNAPEKVLGVTRDFAERRDAEHRALLRGLLRAARWCEQPENRPELVRLLAQRGGVEAPAEALWPWLSGELRVGPGAEARSLPEFHSFHREVAAELGIPRPDADEKVEGLHAAPWTLATPRPDRAGRRPVPGRQPLRRASLRRVAARVLRARAARAARRAGRGPAHSRLTAERAAPAHELGSAARSAAQACRRPPSFRLARRLNQRHVPRGWGRS